MEAVLFVHNTYDGHLCSRSLTSSVLLLFAGHGADTAMVNGNGAHGHAEEADSKQDGNGETDGGEESNEQEVIVIQDTGFTVKIQAPGTEPFDLQVRGAASQRRCLQLYTTAPEHVWCFGVTGWSPTQS